MKRARIRAQNRENHAEIDILTARIVAQYKARLKLLDQSQREALKPPNFSEDKVTIVGRVVCDGCGAHKLRVTLMDDSGNNLATAVSDRNGGYELTTKHEGAACLQISDKDGKTLRVVPTYAKLKNGTPQYYESDVSGLTPAEDPPPMPGSGSQSTMVTVPDLTGKGFEEGAKTLSELGLRITKGDLVDDETHLSLIHI